MANKQIKDYALKTSTLTGDEDLLIQDNGVTRRVKAQAFLGSTDLSNYYTKAEVDNLLANQEGVGSLDLADYYNKADINRLLNDKANINHIHSISNVTNLQESLDSKADKNHTHEGYATKAEVDSLKQSVSDGKRLVADAITGKGIATSATDTFQTMANNINNITTSSGDDVFYGSIIVDKSSVTVNNVKTDSIKVKLSQRPSSTQVVTLTSNGHISLSLTELTFTTANWNVEQSIIITHNSGDYTDHTGTITLSSPNVSDVNIQVNVVNSELIEYSNIVVSSTSVSFNKGESTTFYVKLQTQPTVNQTVKITVDDSNVKLDKTGMTFSTTNWNEVQSVTVSSSTVTTATITLSSNNVPSKTVSVKVLETQPETTDGIEIVCQDDNFSVQEGSSYYVSFSFRGTIEGEKTLAISCNDSKINLSPSYVTVRQSNFNDSFYVSLYADTTELANGRTAKVTFSGDGFKTKEINFTIKNNNVSDGTATYGNIVLDKTSININGTDSATIGVKLDAAPSVNQLVNISIDNNNAQVDKTGLTFNASNYSQYQYVTVRKGLALANIQTNEYVSVITFSSNGVQSKTVNVTITVQGEQAPTENYGEIIISNSVLTIEEGNTTTFTVRLATAPTSNQIVNVSVGASYVATVSPSILTFTPSNYSTNQTVTVNAIKDSTSYVDNSTQITLTSNNVESKTISLTVKNTDQAPGGDLGGDEDTDTYLTLDNTAVRNLVPYISTYYIKPTVKTGEEIILNYFVTDYYGRSYTNNSNFYNYKIIVKRQGKSNIIARNISGGDHSISLGSYDQEGTYHFSIIAIDQYGRKSHELFNYVRVRNADDIHTNVYNVTDSDLSTYSVTINNDKEEREYVTVSSANFEKIENDTQKATVQSAIDNAYNNGSVSSGKYKVFIPMFGASSGTNYKGKTNGWKCLKVKYGSGFDAATFLNQCATNRQNLQRLISEKANAGYNKIVLRQGTYMIDNTPIDIPNGITLDLNGSTIKMCPITGNGALMMRMTDCTDTHLCNGTIEGDYFAHDYAGSTSNSEWVSGVEMGGSCRYCSIRDLTIKNITGYGLQNSISSTSPNGNTFYGAIKVADLEQGDIDRETGQNISCAYRLRSGVSNISAYQGNSEFISMSIHLNYQGNEFSSWNYFMYFYDSGNNFIQAVSAYQYRQVKIPQNAYYVRIVILGERLKSNWNLHYQFFRVPTHCEFRNVTIDNARCVGMAQGQMKDFLVQDCTITNSGQSSATCAYDAEDGWDGMQDAFFENVTIKECPANGFLTCAGHNFVVNNMDSDALYMWERTRWAVVKNSTFEKGCIVRGGGEANIVQHGVTRFYNNTVSAPDYSNYMFMNVAKNCTYTTAPKNGILVNTVVNGATMDRTVYNNDSNNQITDDIGKSTDNVDYGNTGSQNVPVSKVTLNKTSISLALNGTEQLVATVFPTNASNQGVTWSSSATNIASVSSSGLVTGRGSGSATIIARTDDGGYTATCSVQVTSSSSGGTVNYNLTVSSSMTITQGENTYITYSVSNTLPSNCTYEIKRNGSYWCNASLVSTNRINASTTQFSTGTYDNLTLCISYNGAVIATSNTFTLTINQANVTESAILSPASCQVYVGNNQTFTLVNTNATINNYYTSNGKVSIYGTTSTSITVTAQAVGTDYVNVILSDGTSLSSSITIQANTSGGGSTGGGSTGGDSSGGGSTGGGSTGDSEVDANGLVVVKYPALQKPKPMTWCAMGDSITAGTGAGGSSYSYANVCANLAGITAIHNHGIAGSCVCAGYNTALTEPGIETAFCNRFGEMSASADLITVLGSVNDHRADVKVGSPTSTDKNDFYGALYVLITGLKQRYPNGRIVFITPFKISGWNGKNMYGFSLQDFRNAIVTQCNRFQIEVVDLFSEEQFSWLKGLYQGWFYSYDYYHPTPAGHQAIASWLKDQLFGDGSGSSSGGSGGSGGTTTTYGNIVISNTSLTLNENSNTTVNVTLDKAPSSNQTVYITTSGNVSTNTSSLTFTSSNYSSGQTFTLYSGNAGSGTVTLSSNNVSSKTINVTINSTSSGGGSGSGSTGGSTSSEIANSSDTALTQQYSSSHEATPNNSNPPSGAYNWKYAPRINPDGSFPNSTWNAFGHWMTTYKIEGSSLYDNVGLLLQNPKAWIWNTSTRSWDVLSSDFEWGSWYLEDFYDDGNSTIANSVTWEAGVSGNHSTWVKIKQDSTTQGRCFHPWGYQKNWRSNSSWSNNGQPYIVTKVDFKLVKYDENGVDNLSNAQLVVNSGGDWWSEVGATWQPDWSTNRDMCVGKYIKATRELKRAWATNLPSSWSYGLPTDDNYTSSGGSSSGGSSSGGSTGGGSSSSTGVTPSEATMTVGSIQRFTLNSGTINYTYFANGKCSTWTTGSNYIEVKAETTGQDYLNIVLSDGSSISVPITIVASGGSSRKPA